jgi:outer membrane lipoprotein-sorting protein
MILFPEEFMRRSIARALAASSAGLAAAAILLGAGALQAQPAPSMSLPSIAPMPPLPPLPKDSGTPRTANSTAPDTVASTAAAPGIPRPPASNQAIPARADAATNAGLNVAQRAAVERINGYFNTVSTLIGNFVQIGPNRERTEGEFYLQKPGKVRFDYYPPSPVELISDGSSIAVRDRRLATQDLYPLSQTPLRFLLSDKLDLLKDANIVGVFQDDLFTTIVIEEKHPVVGTHRLMIMFGAKDSQLKQWTITDPQGFDTTIAVYNLDQSQRPDPSLFRIEYQRMLQ